MIKKKISVISIILLFIFSFYYTNKVIEIIRNKDPLMIEIKNKASKYNKKALNAKIIDNKIIPGVVGSVVDYNKSYSKMLEYGNYNESLLEFMEEKPTISIDDYYDKYIIQGNSLNKEIALVFKVDRMANLKEIVTILNSKGVDATLFIDGKLLEDNYEYFSSLNQELELLSYGNRYDKTLFKTSLNYLNTITKRKAKYCYAEYDNKDVLELCNDLKLHTIIPTIKIKTNPYHEIVSRIDNASIISFSLTTSTKNNLNTIIDYIRQKGYKLVYLDTLINEAMSK